MTVSTRESFPASSDRQRTARYPPKLAISLNGPTTKSAPKIAINRKWPISIHHDAVRRVAPPHERITFEYVLLAASQTGLRALKSLASCAALACPPR